MGEVVRKDAAVDDIVADGNKTILNAEAKGGRWKQIASERLMSAVALLKKVSSDQVQAEESIEPLMAVVRAVDVQTDDWLGAKADEMWNMIGRPSFDAAYSLIWPGGYSAYAEGSDEEQPDRMDLLAELLEANLHPGVDPVWLKATADEVRARSKAYRAALDAVKSPRAKAKLYAKMKAVLARGVQMELARLKRRYLAEGFTEAEIHQVIPDRPIPKKEKEKGKAEPVKGAPPKEPKGEPAKEDTAKEVPPK